VSSSLQASTERAETRTIVRQDATFIADSLATAPSATEGSTERDDG
jgi:hypothetical protein